MTKRKTKKTVYKERTLNKRVNGQWIMETNASKKRKARIAKIEARREELRAKGRLTSKINKMFQDRIERLSY